MAEINRSEFTREQLAMALECNTAADLMALAKAEGYDITKEQAEAYLDEMENRELDRKDLDKVAGGTGSECWGDCSQDRCLSVLM